MLMIPSVICLPASSSDYSDFKLDKEMYYVELSKSMIRQRFELFCIYCINCLHVHTLNLCCSKNCQLGFLTRADTKCPVQLQKEASVVQWLCHSPCKPGVTGSILGFSSLSVGTINRGHISI